MRAFTCPTCHRLVFFENTACLSCGTELGFDAAARTIVAAAGRPRCTNLGLAGCNWLVEREGTLCAACALTRTRPAGDDPAGLEAFREAEFAKRRLLFELAELRLPTEGLAFDLLSSTSEPVTTGHAAGLITLDLAEADDAHREAMRAQLGEPYRTVLGHFRHEVGHFLFDALATDRERARALFGDEREDYQAALERHYEQGPPADWGERHVSAYATMHPSEDWAETVAHYLHLFDTLQTAHAHGVRVAGETDDGGFRGLLVDWLALTVALNAVNRSMGQHDLYPFTLADPVVEKLAFVHDAIAAHRSARRN
jgi:hypothetical protein